MAKVSLLLDTDIFIDYFNHGSFYALFDPARFTIYFSVVTQKELLTKPGFRESEREAIRSELAGCRLIPISNSIAARYSDLRRHHPSLDKSDALIAATALVKQLPLLTRNKRHFKIVNGLTLFGE
ncbi:MAG: hypothetical protein OJF47_002488 [Nitrospira sp.]|jgi:predicted nucleic acid-binding protein|nr:MAG: hypothetical protein OJF47_002488 [Nitrospira sp.]